ncbi:MAG: restriction endonuclease, partial [Alphaproteobacteria bacterium]|nr:restriction endonuclease [Alphaproteobacteria bacterium]
VYLDPPSNSQANYNVLFKGSSGKGADAQIEAFKDSWEWCEESENAFSEVLGSVNTQTAELLRAIRLFLGQSDMMAYLAMMAVRLLELHRVLKSTGSLYLHCDPTASHYLKLLLDGVFGKDRFRTEISWKRSSAHNDARQGRKQYGNIRDTIFFYTKSPDKWTWNWQYTPYDQSYIDDFYFHIDEATGRRYRLDNLTAAKPGGDTSYEFYGTKPYKGRYWAYSLEKMEAFKTDGRLYFPSEGGTPSYKRYLDEMPGVPLQNDWGDVKPVSGKERLGYPTQKPVALLERILASSSNPGDVVLDPFCGCGTTIHAAQKLGRQWIGIDITHLAISLIERRLKDAFPGISFEVQGTPNDLASAINLARRDKYQFQWWAVSLVEARPYGGKKKGADGGVDGVLFFRGDKGKTEKALISVKGGENVGVGAVRDLIAVVEREKAAVGVLISLAFPTKPMEKEAAAAGFFETPFEKVPKIQILTLAGLFQGMRPRIPRIDSAATFNTAAREKPDTQGRLF